MKQFKDNTKGDFEILPAQQAGQLQPEERKVIGRGDAQEAGHQCRPGDF